MQDDNVEHTMSDSVKLGVMIHRMGVLENSVGEIGVKIDNMGSMYPTMMHVELLAAPLREKLKKLEEKEEERVREQTRQTAQFKLAIILALLSPVFSLLVTIALDQK